MTANVPVQRLPAALAETTELLHRAPPLAEARAREILASAPGHPVGRLLLAAALRLQQRPQDALTIVEPLALQFPGLAGAHYERALALAAAGRDREALGILADLTEAVPNLPGAWRALGDIHRRLSNPDAAAEAYRRHIESRVFEPMLHEGLDALRAGDFSNARNLLRDHLVHYPSDVVALRAAAEAATHMGELAEADALYARCIALAPAFTTARREYAVLLRRLQKPEQALRHLDILLAADPRNDEYRKLKASALAHIGEYDGAIACYTDLLDDHPDDAQLWTFRAHFQRAIGRIDEAIAGYRRSIALRPQHGDAWWSLANLKTFRFTPIEIDAIRAQLARADLSEADRISLFFALGSALEHAGAYDESFQAYARGNALRKATNLQDPYDKKVPSLMATFTSGFFAARSGSGNPAPDPIFVVGMPRAGSTLVEQILSSHSRVEGTMELLEILAFVERLGGTADPNRPSAYPEVLATLAPDAFKALGDEYLERTRVQRKRALPHFVDKTPNNFLHLGLIHLILPNAKVVDVRRHPMSCCFSNFKQHFAQGQNFAYDLADLGRFYSRYVELMAHYDRVLPGKIHRVFYEKLVADPRAEIEALLAHLGLPFEEACLKFHENERPVLTPSSEQVRQPIYTEGLAQWRHYEPWLGPLKAALGPVLDAYPGVPDFGTGR